MAINNGENALHGGLVGFDKVTHSDTAKIPAHTQRALTTVAYIHHEQRVWDFKSQSNDDGSAGVTFTLKAEDKEEGFPGNMSVRPPCCCCSLSLAPPVTLFLCLQVTASYVLTLDNRLLVTFGATTDKVTAAVCGHMC